MNLHISTVQNNRSCSKVDMRSCVPTCAARVPRQHYKFLDVAAEELRGSFYSPADSEEQLLYSARPVRLGQSGLYNARYLLPQVRAVSSAICHRRGAIPFCVM